MPPITVQVTVHAQAKLGHTYSRENLGKPFIIAGGRKTHMYTIIEKPVLIVGKFLDK